MIRPRTLRRLLSSMALVGSLLLAPVTLATTANPSTNIPPDPNFDETCVESNGVVVQGYCSYDARSGDWIVATPQRENAALQAINVARSQEGIGPLVLPDNWAKLTADEQQFVLVNLERIARGLPPLVALAAPLDQLALLGAEAGTDPVPTGWTGYNTGSNWAAEGQVAIALYAYMYEDGWGGSASLTPNLACTSPVAPGCWGHRDNILGDYGNSGLMGAADLPARGSGTGSSTQLFVAYDGPPVPLVYTWEQALLAGAAGEGADPSVPPASVWAFSDLNSVPWAAAAVSFLADAGIVQGTSENTFSPNTPLTLEQWVVLLARALNWSPAPASAAAVPGSAAWAASSMALAASLGLLPAGLSPTADLDRAVATWMLVRALGLPSTGAVAPFSDLAGLPASQQQAIATAAADGMVEGVGGGAFDPSGGLTRADAAVVLLRAILLKARSGSWMLGGKTLTATQLPAGGEWVYRWGDLTLVASGANPVLLAVGPDWGSDAILVSTQGQWWSGAVDWQSASGVWPAGARRYGAAVMSLWPAGGESGPALFQPTVHLAVYGPDDVQYLLPGAGSWVQGPEGLFTSAALTAYAAIGSAE